MLFAINVAVREVVIMLVFRDELKILRWMGLRVGRELPAMSWVTMI